MCKAKNEFRDNLVEKLKKQTNEYNGLIDVSRGGVALSHDNTLKTGDVVPVHLVYGDLEINADAKVVTSTDSRAGAQFINLNQSTANKLLYLNILLEDNNNISFGK